jgi:hypothetical protein
MNQAIRNEKDRRRINERFEREQMALEEFIVRRHGTETMMRAILERYIDVAVNRAEEHRVN